MGRSSWILACRRKLFAGQTREDAARYADAAPRRRDRRPLSGKRGPEVGRQFAANACGKVESGHGPDLEKECAGRSPRFLRSQICALGGGVSKSLASRATTVLQREDTTPARAAGARTLAATGIVSGTQL